MTRSLLPRMGAASWSTVLGAVVSVLAVVLGLRFGAAGLAGTIAIGLFALFVSAAIISSHRGRDLHTSGAVATPWTETEPGDVPARPE